MDVRNPISALGREELDRLVEKLKPPKKKKKGKGHATFGQSAEPLDIEKFILKHFPDALGPESWKGGRRWKLRVCPFNPSHSRREAFIGQMPSGALSFKCHHNSCSGYNWFSLRELLDPEYKEKKNSRNGKVPHGSENDVDPDVDDTEETEEETEESPEERYSVELPREPKARPFPLYALPEGLAKIVLEASEALPCPPDLVAIPMLVVLGTAIGLSRTLKTKEGWEEGPRIYAAIVAKPGELKSPALEVGALPARDKQVEFKAEYDEQKETYAEAMEMYANEKEIRKGRPASDFEEPMMSKPIAPVMAQLLTTDSTIEALGSLLHRNSRSLLLLRDELTGWVRSMDAYRSGRGSDREYWLSFWNAAMVVINRKSNPEPIVIPRPFVSVCGCIPPDVLSTLADERGRDDGFIHRILFAYPDPLPEMLWTKEIISDVSKQRYKKVYDDLYALETDQDENGAEVPVALRFTEKAEKVWEKWFNKHCTETKRDNFPDNLEGPWSKLRGYCVRLALILHLSRLVLGETRNPRVDVISLKNAIALVTYFKAHARRVYARLQVTDIDKRTLKAVRWIEKRGGTVRLRDVHMGKVAGVRKRSEALKLLKDLEAMGHGTLQASARKNQFIFRLFEKQTE